MFSGRIDAEGFERMFQFLAAAADEPPRPLHFNLRVGTHTRAGLRSRRTVHFHAAFHDQAARLRSRDAGSFRYEVIEALEHGFAVGFPGPKPYAACLLDASRDRRFMRMLVES